MPAFFRPVAHAAQVTCVALTAVCLFGGTGFAQPKPTPQSQETPEEVTPVEQVALTDKQVSNLIAGQKEIAAVTAKLPETDSDKPDPKVQAKLDDAAKKFGFANFGEYDAVLSNVSLVLSGFDPESKKFVGPDKIIKSEIAEVQADKQMPAKDRKKALDELNASLKNAAQIKFPDNITIVTKYYDKLAPLMQSDQ